MITKKWNDNIISKESTSINQLKKSLSEAEAVIIGAGAGLSTSAGFVYAGERFRRNFADFEEKYGFHDMYSGGFYDYKSMEEYWAYWSRNIFINRYMDAPFPVYEKLFQLVKDKDYFVLTTNVDHCFQKAGFNKKRLFYTQGDYGLFQCSEPCCQETFDNEEMIKNMVQQQKNMKIPTEMIPKCSHCGKPLTTNLRVDSTFVQDKGWHSAAERYELFERRHKEMKTLYFEIGVGFNTPGIIKYNFWQRISQNPQATYACLNMDNAEAPSDIKKQSICIYGDSGNLIDELL